MTAPTLLWERDNQATYNQGKEIPPNKYCLVKYKTDPILWWNWGPAPVLDVNNPPKVEAINGEQKYPFYSMNETLAQLLDIH